MCGSIIAMAHGLNMRVVAEGVETHEQSDFLLWRRCDDAQGYLFARPMPKAEVPAAVERIVAELRKRAAEQTVDLVASEFGLPQSSRTFINN